jgi:hypothetical protein
MGMAMGFPSYFFISHAFWLLPVVFELLCRNLLREQYQKIMASGEVESWDELWSLEQFENGGVIALVTLERMACCCLPLF